MQEGGCALTELDETKPGVVPREAKQPGEALPVKWDWVEHSIWTERMLEALMKGVKGGIWFSLIILSAGQISCFGIMGFSAS